MIWGGSVLGLVPLNGKMALFALGAGLVNAAVFTGLFTAMERIRKRKMAEREHVKADSHRKIQ